MGRVRAQAIAATYSYWKPRLCNVVYVKAFFNVGSATLRVGSARLVERKTSRKSMVCIDAEEDVEP